LWVEENPSILFGLVSGCCPPSFSGLPLVSGTTGSLIVLCVSQDQNKTKQSKAKQNKIENRKARHPSSLSSSTISNKLPPVPGLVLPPSLARPRPARRPPAVRKHHTLTTSYNGGCSINPSSYILYPAYGNRRTALLGQKPTERSGLGIFVHTFNRCTKRHLPRNAKTQTIHWPESSWQFGCHHSHICQFPFCPSTSRIRRLLLLLLVPYLSFFLPFFLSSFSSDCSSFLFFFCFICSFLFHHHPPSSHLIASSPCQ
jgi:hypothetical protein